MTDGRSVHATDPRAGGSNGGRQAPQGSQKFVTFFLADEEYGIEILKVHEIIGMMNITRVPRTPTHVRGVINLRGKIIPVLDLRLKFLMPPTDDTDQTCIIVVQAAGGQMGVVVDRVSEVLAIDSDDIEETPSFGCEVNTDYILGVGRAGDRVKLLLDIDKVLSAGDVADMQSATQEPAAVHLQAAA